MGAAFATFACERSVLSCFVGGQPPLLVNFGFYYFFYLTNDYYDGGDFVLFPYFDDDGALASNRSIVTPRLRQDYPLNLSPGCPRPHPPQNRHLDPLQACASVRLPAAETAPFLMIDRRSELLTKHFDLVATLKKPLILLV